MAARKLSNEELQAIQRLAKQWGKIVVGRAFGQQGPGLDVDLEEVAQAAAKGLVAGTLEEATEQQNELMGQEHACPSCQRPCLAAPEERTIHVKGGAFQLREPKCYCPTCRRAFFPSASPLEVGRAQL